MAAGPRPLSVRLFAASFLCAALIAFLRDLSDWQRTAAMMAAKVPDISWTWDAVIVLLSARLSIALIPIALVWCAASNFARWMVTLLALGKLINVPHAIGLLRSGAPIDPWWAVSTALSLLAVGFLFTPGAREWFRTKGEDRVAVFS
ncbi:hypothetical protein U4960_01880 [Altererythrobacter sp. H2]|uniref:hypothetical protein n=1 Tax=Altererythrobacter sp. H2 TaxID=3108391 RepID=UPI000BC6D8E0|nr:hypothetical protein [Altererythrobacter sp. H2]OZA92746.1 MAG: hypothetical protein B7X57_07240 [Erythrobacter sp. 34-65-8]WRK96104.1 hypothetical protein U4960_01880 [Altererythrobacter sp. H2]